MAEIIKLGSNGNWGVKPNGVLAYNDENNVFKAIELQSSRASGATYVGEDGLIKDAEVGVPRIDWTNGVGELLLEPQSTNLLPYSEDYSVANYTRRNCTITQNYAISPNGNNDATRVVGTSSDAAIFDNIGVSSGTTYTLSVYLRVESGTLDTTISLGSAGFPDTVGDGGRVKNITVTTEWQRFTLTSTADANAGSDIGVIGGFGGFNNGDSVLIWGAQLEELSYPTSYIRTDGSQVTRIADAVPGNSSLGQVINSSEGTLYFNFRTLTQIPSASNYVSLSNGTTSDSVFFQFRNDGNLRIYHKALGGSDIAFIVAGNDYSSQYYKAAYTWNNSTNTSNLFLNGVKQTLNGGFVYTDISALDKLSLDLGTSGSDFRGRAREIKVYDTALTDAELTTLTTI